MVKVMGGVAEIWILRWHHHLIDKLPSDNQLQRQQIHWRGVSYASCTVLISKDLVQCDWMTTIYIQIYRCGPYTRIYGISPLSPECLIIQAKISKNHNHYWKYWCLIHVTYSKKLLLTNLLLCTKCVREELQDRHLHICCDTSMPSCSAFSSLFLTTVICNGQIF